MRRVSMIVVAILLTITLFTGIIIYGQFEPDGSPLPSLRGEDGPVLPENIIFVVSNDGGMISAKNIMTDSVEYTSHDSAEVLQASIDSLPDGGGILVRPGLYDLSGDVIIHDNMFVVGEGEMRTVFTSTVRGMLVVKDISNVTLSGFGLMGSTGIYIRGDGRDISRVSIDNITATVNKNMSAAFTVDASGRTVSDVTFNNCRAIGGETYGFLNIGAKDGSMVRNITYFNCEAIDNGLSARSHDWVVGFNLAEQTNVEHMVLINCTSSGNWESGFHFEKDITAIEVRFQDCVAIDNGLAKPDPLYGSGFVLQGSIVLKDCTSKNNARTDFLIEGDPRTVIFVETPNYDVGDQVRRSSNHCTER